MNNSRRGSIKKRLVIGLGSTALFVAIGVYFAFIRNHAPVINSADISSQQAYILENGTSNGVQISANVSDKDTGNEGLDRVVAEITTPSGNDSLNFEKTNDLFSSTYKPKVAGNYTVTITAIDGQGKKSKSETLEFKAVLDHKPKVTGYKVFPDTGLYNGDSIEISINATDDIGIESAIFNMKNSDGTSTNITLNKANGSYKATHKIDKPGDYKLDAIVADSAGQVTIMDMGTLKVILDNFPEILDYKVPRYVEPGQKFTPWAKANDDRGIESVVLEIEGVGNFVFNNTKDNLWENPEKISISKKGSYNYILTATDIVGQETIEEGTITVRSSSGGGGGGNGGGGPGITGG